MGLSDHVFVKTTIAIPYLVSRRNIPSQQQQEKITYKWIEGTNLSEYSKSA
jgi:hypothetical protein